MLRLTLAQMRRSAGRLTAAGVAIAIGTAFVAATLLAGGVMRRTAYDAVSASYADADLVVITDEEPVNEWAYGELARIPGVAGVGGELTRDAVTEFAARGRSALLAYQPVPSDPRLLAQVVSRGSLPHASGQVALPVDTASRFGLQVGDQLQVRRAVYDTDPPRQVTETVTLVGTLQDPTGAFARGEVALVTAADARRWAHASGGELRYRTVLLALDPHADPAAVQYAAAPVVPDGTRARTPDQAAQAAVAASTGDARTLTATVLAFAAISLLVAGLVIANTFQVLVAQRTRTLALLRCVGADSRQLHASVVTEAVLLGVLASLGGVLAGVGLAQAALTLLTRANPGVPLPPTVPVSPTVVAVPVAVGLLVTVLAALAPARAATHVSPLAALAPLDAPRRRERAGRARLVGAVALTVGGLAGLGVGVRIASQDDVLAGLAAGLLGGAASFTGLLLSATSWLPRVLALAGRVLARLGGPTARLAVANTLRNPRRTATTSSALLIGVTLVTLMSTGAAGARQAFETELDASYPVDVVIDGQGGPGGGSGDVLRPAAVAAVRAVDGVGAVIEVASAPVTVQTGRQRTQTEVFGVGKQAAAVLRAPEALAGVTEGSVVVPQQLAGQLPTLRDGDRALLHAGDAQALLTVAVADVPSDGVLVTPGTLARLAPHAPVTRVWIALDGTKAASQVVPAVQDAVADAGVRVTGAAVRRAMVESVIDTLLAIVVGLLGVAVVIALIGVTNTLSLSVIERRRESATLRAIGLTRGQLRAMLAVEGVLIAGTGAVLGLVLGTVYGWVGVATVLPALAGEAGLVVPWRDLGLVLAISLVAGLLASVLPARSAVRTPPVAALAVE